MTTHKTWILVVLWFKKHLTLKPIVKFLVLILGILGIFLSIYIWLGIFIDAYNTALNFNGFPTDGTFQLFNPLRRLAAGQTPGVNFQVFHGLGVVLIHFPLFIFLGKNLFASEISRLIISPSIFLLSAALFIYSITRKWYFTALLPGILFLFFSTNYSSLIFAGNASLGLRSVMPILMGACLILLLSQKKYPHWLNSKFPWFELISAILLALSLLIGSEQGISALLGFCLAYICFFQKPLRQRLLGLVYVIIFYSVAVSLIFMSFSGFHFLNNLQYILFNIPSDQFWYFGTSPNPYLISINQALTQPVILYNIGYALILLIISICVHKTKRINYSFVPIFLLLYGLLSNISLLGIFSPAYTEPLLRVNSLLTIWIILLVIPLFTQKYTARLNTQLKLFFTLLTYLVFIILTIRCLQWYINNTTNLSTKIESLTLANQIDQKKYSGVYLSPDWESVYKNILSTTNSDQNKISCYQYTDVNWENGISKNSAGFFLEQNGIGADKLFVGQDVFFAKSGKRTIQSIVTLGKWINVYVDGSVLDPQGDGAPHLIQLAEILPPQPVVWSTYASLFEATNDAFQPSGYDYIIYALGQQKRQAYIDSFNATQPDFVITIKNSYFIYEQWLRDEDWNFYQAVAANYSVVSQNIFFLIWKKNTNQNWITEDHGDWQVARIAADNQSVTLHLPDHTTPEVYEVSVKYKIDNPYQFLPLLKSLPRYVITPFRSFTTYGISLPPYQETFTFPVIVLAGQNNPVLAFSTASIIPGASFTVSSVKYKKSNLDATSVQAFIE